jgi:hypothetical protein
MKNKNLSAAMANKLLTPPTPKQESVGVKLNVDYITALDAMAKKSNKTRGAVVKIILEMGILQLGYDWECLPEKLQDDYMGMIVNAQK